MADLARSGAIAFVHDSIDEQLRELVALREPSRKLGPDELDARVRAHLAGRSSEAYGAWAYFPWSGRLVHVLPRGEHREVRTDRNRYKITRDEQQRLAGATIGVIGLSVGNAAAVTFALEGVGGRFRLADFDRLSLSNLNRLRAGVQDLGVKKTTLAAREMFEIDPYLDIACFPDGVDDEKIREFLGQGESKLDVLIEECDDLYMKVVVRERARDLGIPVVMDTSDRGLLDVERFDLEPSRPVLHGLIGDVRASELRGLPTKEKVPFVLAILGGKRMSSRFAASLPEIDETISTWPQLASGVALGGAITCDVTRRILLGTTRASGRYYVDVEGIARDDAGEHAMAAPPPEPREIAPEATRPPRLPARPAQSGVLGHDAVRWIVAHGALAPSAHNAQPWRFVHRADGVLECRHDPRHDMPTLDFEHGATWVAFGAAVENMDLAARDLGLAFDLRPFPAAGDPSLVCTLHFRADRVDASPLFARVRERVTNRKRGARAPLDPAKRDSLVAAAESRGAKLTFATEEEALEELGALMGACDRISALHPAMFREVMPGYRFTRAEVERHRDGLDLTSMELGESDRAGFELLSEWPTMECLGKIGGGRALESTARKSVAAASAIGLLTVPGTSRESYFGSGRAVQRTWLTASDLGLALHPMTGLVYLFARLERGGAEGLRDWEVRELRELRVRYRRVFDTPADHAETFLFRVGVADPPTARSLRRHLDDVLHVEAS
jgi:nitroreductase